jgi:hypothetical protein
MDKVKHYLEVARKHHFWILCGVAAMVAVIVWMMATNKLAAEFKTREGEIKSQLSALKGINAPHPNETWTTGMEKTTADARESVRSAWTLLYQDQKEKIFKWPAVLGEDFLKAIARVEDGKDAYLKQNLRERYLNRVRDLAKGLPKIVDAAVVEDQMAPGVAPMNPMIDPNTGLPIIINHRVVWDPQSQQEIFDTFTWLESPSTPIVRQAQEELWVYKALCDVIAGVNKDSTGPHDAPITAIQQMHIAYLAQSGSMGGTPTTGRVMRVKTSVASMGGGEDMMRGGMGASMEGGPGAGTPPDPKQRCKGAASGGFGGRGLGFGADAAAPAPVGDPDDMWKAFRYVDETGKPLATAAEVDASPLEFNLMPFRMRLTINPKEIDRLLVEFRNSTLPLLVKEVRVGEVVGTAGATGGGMMGGFGGGFRGGRGGFEDEGGPGMMPMPSGATGMPQQKTIQIEVSGVAYLIKKPDPSKLGPTEGGVPADGAAPVVPAPSAMNDVRREPVASIFERNSRRGRRG